MRVQVILHSLSSPFPCADPESEHPGIHKANEDSQGLGKLRGGMNVKHCLVFLLSSVHKRTIGNNKYLISESVKIRFGKDRFRDSTGCANCKQVLNMIKSTLI